MIEFQVAKDGPDLFLVYTPEDDSGDWLQFQLDNKGKAQLSGRIFNVTKDRLVNDDEVELGVYGETRFIFDIGIISSPYYCIDREVLGLNFDLLIHYSFDLERKLFAAIRNISIFRRFNAFGLSELIIGGDAEGALPAEVFRKLLAKFPNSYEMTRYAEARISSIIRNYLPIDEDKGKKYEKYLNKKESHQGSEPLKTLAPYESEKYNDLVAKIEDMLKNTTSYNETQWQNEILQVILLLFPRYIKAFKEGPINDSWASTTRRVDFLLVDAAGYIDVIEIKKPTDEHAVTSNLYRGNHIPLRELSGTIMQVEKYLFHFNRSGQSGEQKLTKKYSSELAEGFEIKIVNPTGIIIMGRDKGLTTAQKNDFEVIRRQYRNLVDIITYDDLLRRLKVIRDHFYQVI